MTYYILSIDQNAIDPREWIFCLGRGHELPAVPIAAPVSGAVEIHGEWNHCLRELCRTLEAVEFSGTRKRNYPAHRKSTPRGPRLPIADVQS